MDATSSDSKDPLDVGSHVMNPRMSSASSIHDLNVQNLVLEVDVHQDPMRVNRTAANEVPMQGREEPMVKLSAVKVVLTPLSSHCCWHPVDSRSLHPRSSLRAT